MSERCWFLSHWGFQSILWKPKTDVWFWNSVTQISILCIWLSTMWDTSSGRKHLIKYFCHTCASVLVHLHVFLLFSIRSLSLLTINSTPLQPVAAECGVVPRVAAENRTRKKCRRSLPQMREMVKEMPTTRFWYQVLSVTTSPCVGPWSSLSFFLFYDKKTLGDSWLAQSFCSKHSLYWRPVYRRWILKRNRF